MVCFVVLSAIELLGNATSFLSKLWWSEERQWLVSFRSPLEIWRGNPTYVMLEVVTCIRGGSRIFRGGGPGANFL